MNSTIDLYMVKWATLNFFDLVQVYRDLDEELEHVCDELSHAVELDRQAYFQGAMTALKSSQGKLLAKLADILQEQGYLDPFDCPNRDSRILYARPIMEMMVQDLFN